MTKVFGKTVLVGMLVLSLAFASLAGGVCTMACGDDAAACCCRSVGPSAVEILERPSCCEPEFSSTGADVLKGERVASNGSSVLSHFALPVDREDPRLSEAGGGGNLYFSEDKGAARSSPLFLLNAVFLI
jgi:hypothetical protein